jgi:D-serine deaminase-like pyridoxal phosphate-dependent protein
MFFKPAALLVARIISLLDETKLCIDLGHKSVAAENPLDERVYFINAPELKVIGQMEEHLLAELPLGHSKKVGDVLYGMPIHICPTCALYGKASIVEKGKVDDSWDIVARERKITV